MQNFIGQANAKITLIKLEEPIYIFTDGSIDGVGAALKQAAGR